MYWWYFVWKNFFSRTLYKLASTAAASLPGLSPYSLPKEHCLSSLNRRKGRNGCLPELPFWWGALLSQYSWVSQSLLGNCRSTFANFQTKWDQYLQSPSQNSCVIGQKIALFGHQSEIEEGVCETVGRNGRRINDNICVGRLWVQVAAEFFLQVNFIRLSTWNNLEFLC